MTEGAPSLTGSGEGLTSTPIEGLRSSGKSSILCIFPFGTTSGSCSPIKPERGNPFAEKVVKNLLGRAGQNVNLVITYAATTPYGECGAPVNPNVIISRNHPEIPKSLFDRLAASGSMNYFQGESGYQLYERLVVADLGLVLQTLLEEYNNGRAVTNVVLLGMYRPSLVTVRDILGELLNNGPVDVNEVLKTLKNNGINGIKQILEENRARGKRADDQGGSRNTVTVTYYGIVDGTFVPDGNKFEITEVPDSHPLRFVRDVLPPKLREYLNRCAKLISGALFAIWGSNINVLRSRLGLPPLFDLRQSLYGDVAIVNDNATVAGVEVEGTFLLEPNFVHTVFKICFGFNYPENGKQQQRYYVGPLVGKLPEQNQLEIQERIENFVKQRTHIVVVNMGSTGTELNIKFVLKLLREAIKDKVDKDKNVGILILGAGHSSTELGIQNLLKEFGDSILYVEKFDPLKLYDIIVDNGNVNEATIFIHGGRGTLYDLLVKIKGLRNRLSNIKIVGIPTQVEQEKNIKRLMELFGPQVVIYIDPYRDVGLSKILEKLGLENLVIRIIASNLIRAVFGSKIIPPVLTNLDPNDLDGYKNLREILREALNL